MHVLAGEALQTVTPRQAIRHHRDRMLDRFLAPVMAGGR
jgi:hypothetical protein